jgi:ABC-type multidrug transport system ATPase subunit
VRAFLSGAGPTAFLDMPWIAARVAGAHEMILRLPDGYGTRLGERGTALSAGQRQRIGLARAVFGRPFLVLDEPNANLDADGENALVNAIEILRNEQSIVISHRPNALAALNMAMVIYGGRAIAFGPREDVFARVARRGAANLGSRVSRVAAGVVPSPNPLTVRPRATMTRTMSTSRRRRLSGSCDDCKDFLTKSAISSGSPMQLICDAMIDRRFGHASDAPL